MTTARQMWNKLSFWRDVALNSLANGDRIDWTTFDLTLDEIGGRANEQEARAESPAVVPAWSGASPSREQVVGRLAAFVASKLGGKADWSIVYRLHEDMTGAPLGVSITGVSGERGQGSGWPDSSLTMRRVLGRLEAFLGSCVGADAEPDFNAMFALKGDLARSVREDELNADVSGLEIIVFGNPIRTFHEAAERVRVIADAGADAGNDRLRVLRAHLDQFRDDLIDAHSGCPAAVNPPVVTVSVPQGCVVKVIEGGEGRIA